MCSVQTSANRLTLRLFGQKYEAKQFSQRLKIDVQNFHLDSKEIKTQIASIRLAQRGYQGLQESYHAMVARVGKSGMVKLAQLLLDRFKLWQVGNCASLHH